MMDMHFKNILFIGDSLIEFFDWQDRFPGHEVTNLGRAGETVEGLLSRVERIIGNHPSPDLIFIMTGINNVAMEDLDSLDPYRKVIEQLSAAYPETGIFIHSLLPTMLPWITNASIQEMNRSLAGIAKEKGVEFIDLYSKFIDTQGMPMKAYLLSDGVHLSDKGYAVWAKAVEGIVNKN